MRDQPSSEKPSPAKIGLIIGLSIGPAMLVGKIAGDLGKNLMGEVAWWLLGVPAGMLAGAILAVVVAHLVFRKKN